LFYSGKPHSGMAMALTTGHFDIRNTGVSTCIYICMYVNCQKFLS